MLTSTKKCASCKTDILLDNAMLLHWCTKETVVSETVVRETVVRETVVSETVVSETDLSLDQPLLCKNCTYICDRCKVGGCSECVKTECCDCSIMLCIKCSDVDDLMCDCFGKPRLPR